MPEKHRRIESAEEVDRLAGEALYSFDLEDGSEVLYATTDERELVEMALRGECGPDSFVRGRCDRAAVRNPELSAKVDDWLKKL